MHRSVGAASNGTPPFELAGTHPFRRAALEIWAPEEDSSEYYGRFRPVALGAAAEQQKGLYRSGLARKLRGMAFKSEGVFGSTHFDTSGECAECAVAVYAVHEGVAISWSDYRSATGGGA